MSKGNFMIKIDEKKNCCGCTACASICPKECIYMEFDDEGFMYPRVDYYKCINCYMCKSVCPFKVMEGINGNVKNYV